MALEASKSALKTVGVTMWSKRCRRRNGTVYKAAAPATGQTFAIKVVSPNMDQ